MSLFVEVDCIQKNKQTVNTKMILNMDDVSYILPLVKDGVEITMTNGDVVRVSDNYSQFKQFVMQTVTSADIQKKIEALQPKKYNKEPLVDADDIKRLMEKKQQKAAAKVEKQEAKTHIGTTSGDIQ